MVLGNHLLFAWSCRRGSMPRDFAPNAGQVPAIFVVAPQGGRKGRRNTVPFLSSCLEDRSQLGRLSGLWKSALGALGVGAFSALALLRCAGLCCRTGRTSRSWPAQFGARELAVGILVQ